MNRTKGISKIYMTALPLLPVFAQYSVFNGQLDLDVIVMLGVMILFLLLKRSVHIKYPKLVILLMLYIVAITAINIIAGTLFVSTSTVAMRAGRYCLYLFIVLFLAMEDVEYVTIMRIYRVIVYAAFAYILLQTIAYYGLGIVLPHKIGGQLGSARNTIGRLRSFYSEPADMAYSVTPFVVCSLFGPHYSSHRDTRFRDAVVATAAVFLATSSQGTACVILVWAVWFLTNYRTRRMTARGMMAIIAVIAVVLVVEQFGVLEYSLGRLEMSKDSSAWEARRGGFTALSLLSLPQKIFGAGYGNYLSEKVAGLDTYGNYINYSSMAESLFTLGYVGTGMIALLLIKAYMRGHRFQKILTLTLLFFSIGGCPLTGKYMPLYFSLIMLGKIDLGARGLEKIPKRSE